jgi:hypothetical protein
MKAFFSFLWSMQVMFVYESSYSTHTNQNVNLSPFTMGYVECATN